MLPRKVSWKKVTCVACRYKPGSTRLREYTKIISEKRPVDGVLGNLKPLNKLPLPLVRPLPTKDSPCLFPL